MSTESDDFMRGFARGFADALFFVLNPHLSAAEHTVAASQLSDRVLKLTMENRNEHRRGYADRHA